MLATPTHSYWQTTTAPAHRDLQVDVQEQKHRQYVQGDRQH